MSRLKGPLKNHKGEEHWPKYEENLEKVNGVLGWSLDYAGMELEDQEYHIKYYMRVWRMSSQFKLEGK